MSSNSIDINSSIPRLNWSSNRNALLTRVIELSALFGKSRLMVRRQLLITSRKLLRDIKANGSSACVDCANLVEFMVVSLIIDEKYIHIYIWSKHSIDFIKFIRINFFKS